MHLNVAFGSRRITALVHFAQSVFKRFDEKFAARGVFQEVFLQIRIAVDDPDVAQHLKKHAGAAARAALVTQFVENDGGFLAQQTPYDLSIGKRGVVVRNFADAFDGVGFGFDACRAVFDLHEAVLGGPSEGGRNYPGVRPSDKGRRKDNKFSHCIG